MSSVNVSVFNFIFIREYVLLTAGIKDMTKDMIGSIRPIRLSSFFDRNTCNITTPKKTQNSSAASINGLNI
jgi:hypothetical protein